MFVALNKQLDFIYQYYSKRLVNKTMMFPIRIAGTSEFIFNRFQHVKMVSNISEKISDVLITKGIHIDKDVVESIAKLHDVGHTPFGHAGEEKINSVIRYNGHSFTEEMPGYFKHNIFSAKIVLEEYPFADWRIVDGVLKHSTIFKSDFNVLASKEYNIIKLNYIFRQDTFSHLLDKPFSKFISNLDILNLHSCSDNVVFNVNGYNNIEYCKKCGFICKKKNVSNYSNDHKVGINISSYLTYPYPLTYEGSIVHIADEIASFISDLSDYFVYLNKIKEIVFGRNVVKKQIDLEIELNKSKYPNSLINAKLGEYLDFLVNDYNENFLQIRQAELLKTIIDYIVVPNGKTLLKKNGVFIRYDVKKNKCMPLIEFAEEFSDLRLSIKNTIYGFIHSTKEISENNKTGQNIIEDLIIFYSAKLKQFVNDYKAIIKRIKKADINVLKNLISAFGKIFVIYGYGLDKNADIGVIASSAEKMLNVKAIGLNDLYDIFAGHISKQISKSDEVLIKEKNQNIFIREISYLVALLTDDEAFELWNKYKYNPHKKVETVVD